MRLLSSESTSVYKRGSTFYLFGFLGLLFFWWHAITEPKNANYAGFPLILLGLAAFTFFVLRTFVWDLPDEVWEDNDSLIVRKKGREARIDLLNIINVNSTFSGPARVTLMLRKPCIFGKKVSFLPPPRVIDFDEHPIASDLYERIQTRRRMAESHAGN